MSDPNTIEILIVEDTAEDLELALRALVRGGAEPRVQVARDGAEALDFMFCEGAYANRSFENSPKVILLDLKLPKVDGVEVLRRLKGDERTKFTPVVALTSSREQRDVRETYRLGVNSYIVKPVTYEAFAVTMQEIGRYWLSLNEIVAGRHSS